MTFYEIGLGADILRALDDLEFIAPTPIQEKTIPHLLNSDKDLIALAQTGTGKTAAFGLPILEKINYKSSEIQCLVLCPTRELCLQITSDFAKFSKYLSNVDIIAAYGGSSIEMQIKALQKGAQIVIGTPGRINDLINRKKLKLTNIKYLVLDEADEMLSMGFKDELDAILSTTPKTKQTLLFSATMPRDIADIAKNYMKEADELAVNKTNIAADNVKHHYYMVHAKDRYLTLKRIADIYPDVYAIVFCRTRIETKEVADKLIQDGYNADALHGDLSQAQRDHVMSRFRLKGLQLLVATDVAARGLDVQDLTHVINYNLPEDNDVYIHRSGRTGRAGKNGISVSIVNLKEMFKVKEIERRISKKFERKLVPVGTEICEKRLFAQISKMENIVVNEEQISEFLPDIYNKLEWLSREELIKRFVSVEFNSFLEYYKNAPDLNVSFREEKRDYKDKKLQRPDSRQKYNSNDDFRGKVRDKDRDHDRKRNSKKQSYSRFFINLGSVNNISVPKLIGLINDNTKNRSIDIGKIDIMKKFSFFDIDSTYEGNVLDGFRNARFKGEPIVVELAKEVK